MFPDELQYCSVSHAHLCAVFEEHMANISSRHKSGFLVLHRWKYTDGRNLGGDAR